MEVHSVDTWKVSQTNGQDIIIIIIMKIMIIIIITIPGIAK